MRLIRGVTGALLWIGAGLVGLVAVLLCVTIILLPVGLPLLGLARRMFGTAVALMLPRQVAHPVDETAKKLSRSGSRARGRAGELGKDAGKKAGKTAGKAAGKAAKAGKKAGRSLRGKKRSGLGRRTGPVGRLRRRLG